MIRFAAYIIVAGIAAAGTNHVASASTRHVPAGTVEILINGTPQQRYFHKGRWYIEAIKGREYGIQLRNPYGVRVAVALSVDGLNTIDARETTAAGARKWVLEPYQTVTISGWQTSRTTARRFEFTTEEDSYGQALGTTANLGVITAVFFKERVQPPAPIADATPEIGRAQPRPAAPAAQKRAEEKAKDEYAATGMGRATDHAVTQVFMDLEDRPAQTVNIRYEFRPQLVRLGVLPKTPVLDPLQRREKSNGFAPEVPRRP
jgi:hypothetical protein